MTSRKDPFFSFRLTQLVLTAAKVPPGDAARFLDGMEMPESALREACTMPLSRVNAFMDAAAMVASDPLFGLHLAAHVPEGTYEATELIVRTAATVGAGLKALVEHASLVNPSGEFRFEETSHGAELHHVVAGQRDGLGVQMNEFALAYVVHGFRRASVVLPLTAVWFAHERRRGADAVAAHFGAPIRFGAPTSGFRLSHKVAALPLRSADGVVFDYLRRQAGLVRAKSAETPFSVSVMRAIEEELGLEKADLPAVAAHLGITTRTAQRRLSEEGTQFRDVRDQARRRQAEILAARGVDDARIATLLGFVDLATYRRASRRWRSGGS